MTPLQEAVSRGRSAVVWTFIKKHKVDISQYDEVKYLLSSYHVLENFRGKNFQEWVPFADKFSRMVI